MTFKLNDISGMVLDVIQTHSALAASSTARVTPILLDKVLKRPLSKVVAYRVNTITLS
jgi:hypothetical protein